MVSLQLLELVLWALTTWEGRRRSKLRSKVSRNRYAGVFFLAAMMMVAAAAPGTVSPARRQQAIAAFEKAEQMRTALETQTESKRRKDDYKKVIDAYLEVYRLNIAYSKSPVALTAVAELYREMGRTFSSDTYALDAIKTYRLLIESYPQNHLSRDAMFAIADVYQHDLEDPDEARKTYEDFITMYPKSGKVEQARESLKQLDVQAAEKAKAHPAPAAAPAVDKTAEEQTSGLRQVAAIRHWVGPNYLRIVIEVGGEVKFESLRLSNPDRIVIDLQNAHVNLDMANKPVPVENGFLKQIRLAQYTPNTARVVLDVEKIESYSIFSLPNPFRLVIDVQGTTPTQIATAVKPAPPASTESRNPEKAHPSAAANPPAPRVEAGTKAPPASTAKAESATKPAPPAGRETTSVSATPVTKPDKKSKVKSETTTGEVTPPILPAAPTESGSRTLTRALGLKIGRIVIDPGHGGHDTGTIGPTGLEEKNVVLDVGLKLKKLLEQNAGYEVVMTRSDDTFIPLEERTAVANEKSADLFISIHANASPDKSARGIETYYLNFTSSPDALEVAARENASSQEQVHQLQDLIKKIAMTEKIEESQDFAKQVQREIYARVNKVSGAQHDRGIKKAPFIVLIGANMPSILAEISFLTNPKDERMLKRSDYREKIASALYEGIMDYVKTLGEVKPVQRVAADRTSAATRPEF